jgi:predicted dehydrogenase
MALNYRECVTMVEAFRRAGVPLWVAYYRRAQPRFLLIRDLLQEGKIGRVSGVRVELRYVLSAGAAAQSWHFNPALSGGGLIFDVGSHCVDLLDFYFGPIRHVEAFAVNTGRAYQPEDAVAAAFQFNHDLVGTADFNFNAFEKLDRLTFVGTKGELTTPVFGDEDVIVRSIDGIVRHPLTRPPHVHQPLIQSIVDELQGRGHCESTGESGARASWVLEQCVKGYRAAD